jgi:site-specific DNA-methyltransferase (adenine-specific)
MKIIQGDCLEELKSLPDCSVDSIVTDPPYGLSFMGKKWDYDVPAVEVWEECLRVLKPGGHLLAFAGTRTQHRMAVRIEDAGFEIRDMIAWVYGSGFPKSLDVSKAIDKAAGADVSADGYRPNGKNATHGKGWGGGKKTDITSPATEAAKQWSGWGTALKPALEPITMARKPLSEGTVAANVLQHGTGALNVDGCRVGAAAGDEPLRWEHGRSMGFHGAEDRGPCQALTSPGRWPANLIHDGSEEVVGLFPAAKGMATQRSGENVHVYTGNALNHSKTVFPEVREGYNDSGSAARFFYCAKASKADRGDGNAHPTVKPTELMRYLCRLVTPPGGVVLDPFMGSGSTGKAAILEGFGFIGIERESEYVEIAKARIEFAITNKPMI